MNAQTATSNAPEVVTQQPPSAGLPVDTAAAGMNTPDQLRNNPSLWTTAELAHYLVCTERNILFLRKRGLPAIRIGGLVRFDPEAVREWLARQDEPADPRAAQLRDIAASPETDAAECAASDLHKEFPDR